MDEIKLNIPQAEKAVSELKAAIDNMTGQYEKMKNEHYSLKGRWNGESSRVFSNYCYIMEKNLLGRINELQKLSESLNEAKEVFIEKDENMFKGKGV